MNFFLTDKNIATARAGDAERDKQNWTGAAELYTRYLGAAGYTRQTFRYVVQLGNCLKEAGLLERSLAAYDAAERIDQTNADLYLQRGHLLKLMGNPAAAAYAYQKAYNLDPTNLFARHEIEATGTLAVAGVSLPDTAQALHTIWFDITDFMDYARHNVSLSGIQRVCANLMLHLKQFSLAGYRIVPALPDYGRKQVHSVRTDSFLKLIAAYEEEIVSRDNINDCINDVMRTRTPAQPVSGDIFVVAGAFWIFDNYDAIAELRHDGIKFGLFVHDLIQIREKDYVMPDATERFQIQLSDAIEVCDFVLTNSVYVEQDVRRYAAETKHIDLPVKAVVLPTELKSSQTRKELTNASIKDMAATDYVLCVSTIEVRKNHPLLISVWEKLHEELGDNTPNLVLVGKWGWQIDEFREYVDKRGYVGDWLFIFNGISDIEMEYLYKNSMFTIYPSFAEGFGLPIGESLVYGKPCIASNTTSMPEVGGDFVRYIDPFDWKSAYPVIRAPIVDRANLKQWEERIRTEFKPKTWSDFSEEFYRAVVDCAQVGDNRERASLVSLPSAQLIDGGNHDILIKAQAEKPLITFRAARHKNWHAAENWGAWSSNRRCEIAFRSDLAAGEEVEIFLRLHRKPSQDPNPFVFVDAGLGKQRISLTGHPTFFRFTGLVEEGGVVHLKLLARGKFPPGDGREIYVGWSGLAYCRHGDARAQAATFAAVLPLGAAVTETLAAD